MFLNTVGHNLKNRVVGSLDLVKQLVDILD
jgi:hypothetical protein